MGPQRPLRRAFRVCTSMIFGGTAVTRLSEAGLHAARDCAVHRLVVCRDVAAILDAYLARTDKLGIDRTAKLERATR